MKAESTDVFTASVVAVEAAQAFSAFNPSIFTIRRFPDEYTQRDIRLGSVLAVVFSLLLAILGAKLTGSTLPFVAALGADAFMVGVYEYAMRHPVPTGKSINGS